MTELILLLQAEIDIQSAYNRYDGYQSNRGRIFLQRLDAALTMMRRHPEIGSVFASPFRRMLVRDFPYGVFYEGAAKATRGGSGAGPSPGSRSDSPSAFRAF